MLEREHALVDAAGGGDHDDHQHLRLQRQHLDVADRGGIDRRRRDDREQVRHLGERLGRDPHRLVDLAPHQRERQRRRGDSGSWAAAGRRSTGSRTRSGPGRRRCADAGAGRAPRGSRARAGSSRRPTRNRSTSDLEPTGAPASRYSSTRRRRTSSWRSLSTPMILGADWRARTAAGWAARAHRRGARRRRRGSGASRPASPRAWQSRHRRRPT